MAVEGRPVRRVFLCDSAVPAAEHEGPEEDIKQKGILYRREVTSGVL
jgi:hypothetical protein